MIKGLVFNNLYIIKFGILCTFFSLNTGIFSDSQLIAQSREKKTAKKEKNNFWKEDMWYGGGLSLAFSSGYNSSLGLNGNQFLIGISPMAGYKINSFWSAGPRMEFSLLTARYNSSPKVLKSTATKYGVGAFTRLKFLKVIFAHFEYSLLWDPYYLYDGFDLNVEHETRDQFVAGLGYNPSGLFSYEFYILYDFLGDPNSSQLPIEYRVGITYNF